MDERLGQSDALAIAVRQVPDLLPQDLRETAHLDDVSRALLLERRLVQVPEVARELQILENAHLEIERRSLRQIPQTLANLQRLASKTSWPFTRAVEPAGRR